MSNQFRDDLYSYLGRQLPNPVGDYLRSVVMGTVPGAETTRAAKDYLARHRQGHRRVHMPALTAMDYARMVAEEMTPEQQKQFHIKTLLDGMVAAGWQTTAKDRIASVRSCIAQCGLFVPLGDNLWRYCGGQE